MKKKQMHTRASSAIILAELFTQQQPFVPYLAKAYDAIESKPDKAFITELCFQTLRAYPKLELISQQLLDKPFRKQDTDIFCLLLIGLGELDRDQKSHAAIFEAVEGCVQLDKTWAKKVVNACLRRYQREKELLAEKFKNNLIYETQHPKWLIAKIQAAWPNAWQAILAANNQHPPMTIWVNPKKISLASYQAQFETSAQLTPIAHCPFGLTLATPITQTELPGYDSGQVNVQNASAQLAAQLLNLQDAASPLRILDACAAPGNKTATLLSQLTHSKSRVLAIDVHKKRLHSAKLLLARLGLDTSRVSLEVANAAKPESWWDKTPFDRILLDAPCSGTGVIRRHPDIKYLLTPERLTEVQIQQAQLLKALWPLLKPGGLFLYATCSILPEENEAQINQLVGQFSDVSVEPLKLNAFSSSSTLNSGLQLFPDNQWDGFYYCLMSKKTRRN